MMTVSTLVADDGHNPVGLPPDQRGQPLDLELCLTQLRPLNASQRLLWGLRTFGENFALTTSFGIQSAVLLHMLSQLYVSNSVSTVPVIWVDTGYLPAETYRYAEDLCGHLRLQPTVVQAQMSPARMEALHGRLWETGRMEDMELYHQVRKVQPLDQAFEQLGVRCWASGVRQNQTDHRRSMAPLDVVRKTWSLRPLLHWTSRDTYNYIEAQGLPQHPLFERGYSSVGDWHSSGPDDGLGRGSRFGGLKQECGIHLPGMMGDGI